MKKLFYFIFSASTIGFTSCDYVSKPLEVQTDQGGSVDSTVVRKILLEDYTGHECGNCPTAARLITNTIIPAYGEKVIAVGVHAGFFAETGSAPFTKDFTTPAGDDYDSPTYFNISPNGNPSGMINRIHFNSTSFTHIKLPNSWATYVDSLAQLPATAGIKITCSYSASTRIANLNLESTFLSNFTGNYKLVVMLTQDSIIAPQKDYSTPSPSVVTDYVHKHVLRDMINGTWGEDIITTGSVTQGQVVNKSYSYTIPATIKNITCDDHHCHIVAYIYNVATYEVMQAEEIKVIP